MVGLRDGLESSDAPWAVSLAIDRNKACNHTGQQRISTSLQSLGQQLTETLHTEAVNGSRQAVNRAKGAGAALSPKVITDLIESQFQLLYDGLRPVLEASGKQKPTRRLYVSQSKLAYRTIGVTRTKSTNE